MKKKILLSLSLIAIMTVLFAISISAAKVMETWDISATSSDNVTATIYTDYSLVITGNGNMKNWSSAFGAPWNASYYSYRSKISSVTIKDGVTSIGSYAFWGCTGLTSVTIGNSVISVGNYAFRDCTSLTIIYCEAKAKTFGWDSDWNYSNCPVVWDCNNNDVATDGYIYTVLDGVIYGIKDGIATVVKYVTSSIKETNIEANITYKKATYPVTSIGNKSFYNCTNLTSVTIGNNVTSIGNSAFSSCTSLTSIVITNSVTSIGTGAFSGCTSLTSIVIPNSVTSIGNSAFSSCTSLTSIEIPNSVTSICEGAFYNCKSLTSIVITNSVTSIGYYAFWGCTSLTIYCEATSKPSGWHSEWNDSNRPVVWGHAHEYDNTTDLCVCGAKNNYIEKWDISATSSDNVVAYLYAEEDGYYSLVITGNGNMKNWSYASDVPWYSSYRSKISSVTIKDGVTSIGTWAFSGCTSLISIVIPNSVTSVGDNAFYYCTSLTYNEYDNGLYLENSENPYLVFVSTKNENITTCTINERTKFIYSEAFSNCRSLRSIVIPNSVTSIGDSAFTGCISLTSVNIPNGVTSIGNSAFRGCTSLTSITLPFVGATKDGTENAHFSYIFGDSTNDIPSSLKTVIITDAIRIGNYAFRDCTSLTSIEISGSVTSIGHSAFSGCTSLASIEIPNGVTSIGVYAFNNCTSLASVVIPNSVTSIGDYAFRSCAVLTIYCEAKAMPSGWSSSWNYSNCPVVWDCENELMKGIYTFKGYSFGHDGTIAVGFDIDYEAISFYEELTGEILEIGVVFAGLDNLAGAQPLDKNGNAINGKSLKFDITNDTYKYYDFKMSGLSDKKDTKLVISAYIYNGETVKYEQEKGISDTVSGISYNEAKGKSLLN